MSRIDEALRRAAQEQSADRPGDGPLAPRLEAQEAETLAREPFPIEISGKRTRVSPSATASAVDEPDITAPSADTTRTLFDRIDTSLAEKVVADGRMAALPREQYRRLAGVLHDAQGSSDLHVVLIASALPSEGKTLTAANVALTLSESYRRRVLLVDADLRKPALHQVFRLNAAAGLLDGLEASTDMKLVLRQVSPRLAVLPAGRPTSDPMAALTSDRMRRLLDEAKQAFDWVIIDSPPLMLLPDAHLLASLVDAAVLVIKAQSTAHATVKRTIEIIGRQRIIGVVLNQAQAQPSYGMQYDHYYSGYAVPARTDGSDV
jgi:capsular exopolysaccharide synthesis family protein